MYRELVTDLTTDTLLANAQRLQVAVQEAENMLIELEEQQIELKATNDMLKGTYRILTETSYNLTLKEVIEKFMSIMQKYVTNHLQND